MSISILLHLASFSTEGQKGTPAESSSPHPKAEGCSRSNQVPSGDTCCCLLSTWWGLGNCLGGELYVPQLQCLHCSENITKPSNLLRPSPRGSHMQSLWWDPKVTGNLQLPQDCRFSSPGLSTNPNKLTPLLAYAWLLP